MDIVNARETITVRSGVTIVKTDHILKNGKYLITLKSTKNNRQLELDPNYCSVENKYLNLGVSLLNSDEKKIKIRANRHICTIYQAHESIPLKKGFSRAGVNLIAYYKPAKAAKSSTEKPTEFLEEENTTHLEPSSSTNITDSLDLPTTITFQDMMMDYEQDHS